MADYQVTLFVSPWCEDCLAAKSYLDQKGIQYEQKNIQETGAKGELLHKTGQLACPTIIVDKNIVVGYVPEKWDHLLAEQPLELT